MKNIYSLIIGLLFTVIIAQAQTFNPTRGATGVSISPIITITFDQGSTVTLGEGKAIYVAKTDWSAYEELKTSKTTPPPPYYSQDPRLSVSGNVLTIDLSGNTLDASTEYEVYTVSGTILVDGVVWDNLTDENYWRFTTTAPPTPPSITKYLPVVGDTTVRLTDTLKLIFNEPVQIGSAGKYIKIKQASDSANLDIIETVDAKISLTNDTILSIVHNALLQDTNYFVTIDTGFVKSVSTGTDFLGIFDATEWIFRAIKVRNWTGTNGTTWTDAGNWDSNGDFVNGAVVNIPLTTTKPVVSSGDTIEIADLIIEAGGGITIDEGASVTVDSVIELKSSVSANAYLLCNGTLNYDTLDIKIHQNIEASSRWYYISSPVVNATGNSIDCDGAIYYWDNAEGVWRQGSLTDTLEVGGGYTLWSNNDLVFTGKINTDTVIVNLDYGKSVGWNLVGNPYTNSIDWNDVTRSSDSVFNGFWLYINDEGQYGTYNGNTNTNINLDSYLGSIIPSNHSFWVRSDTTVTERLTFTSACKSTTTGTYLKNSTSTKATFPTFKFSINNGTLSDEALVTFSNPDEMPISFMNMTKKFAENKEIVQPYFISGKKSFCMKGVPIFDSEAIVPFAIRIDATNTATSFTFNKISISNFPDNIVILLHDKKTGQFIDLISQRSYNFTETNKGDITNRFELVFKGDITTAVQEDLETNSDNDVYIVSGDKQFTLYLKNDVPADVKIYNLSGQIVGENRNITSKKVIGVPSRGFYVVRISQNGKTVAKKVFVK